VCAMLLLMVTWLALDCTVVLTQNVSTVSLSRVDIMGNRCESLVIPRTRHILCLLCRKCRYVCARV
jgi:hypothetical protein